MKRSEINEKLRWAHALFDTHNFNLPPFAEWTPEEWKHKGHECDEIRHNMMGWDITDFGRGNFKQFGLVLFTLRNGNPGRPAYTKRYAEKIMALSENQICPLHFHWNKMEDIINRGGGWISMQLYNATEEEEIDKSAPVVVSCDGVEKRLPAGQQLILKPGESITLEQRVYHRFWAAPDHGPVIIGEVSTVNDDTVDNKFVDETGRFPEIQEDEPPIYLLCNEYPQAE